MEHKSFKIVDVIDPYWTPGSETYQIRRSLFYEKTLKILKLSRSALIYLSFLIYIEEKQRSKNRGDKFVMPIKFIKINDKDKI